MINLLFLQFPTGIFTAALVPETAHNTRFIEAIRSDYEASWKCSRWAIVVDVCPSSIIRSLLVRRQNFF